MPAYLVVEAVITDWERFAQYSQVVPGLVAARGGEYIVLGGEAESLEGDWGDARIVMHRWPDMDTARAFWHSPEYAEAKKLREGTGEFRVMLLDGLGKEQME